ncbi:unnamed protein product [Orchesella dallaii]|uniref:Uncharacterized protein n=1 Tax=Orchesella dallaii TaxID=48710 RepID=A0ABP1S381_9HEXA
MIKNAFLNDFDTNNKSTRRNSEFTSYQRKVLNRLSHFGVSRALILKLASNSSRSSGSSEKYSIENIPTICNAVYWILRVNAGIKAVFLAFLVMDYFGPVVFFDKIAALDFILCIALIVLADSIWSLRYPFYEILHSTWKVLNSIFLKLGCLLELQGNVDQLQKSIMVTHM